VLSTTDILQELSETTEPEPREMLYLDVHRLFVESHGRLVGVISQTDIVAAVATAKI
jgi:CBS-domain-containing membrane protein